MQIYQGIKKQGFTLIELLVVITIIGLLSTLAVFALNSARVKARDAKRINDLKIISDIVEIYYIDNNKYPIDNGVKMCASQENKFLSFKHKICSGYPLKFDSEIYIQKLPIPPQADLDLEAYWYEAGDYNPPCVYTLNFETDFDIHGGVYWCQGGHCEAYNEDTGVCPLYY